jgi:hypothetical protein
MNTDKHQPTYGKASGHHSVPWHQLEHANHTVTHCGKLLTPLITTSRKPTKKQKRCETCFPKSA